MKFLDGIPVKPCVRCGECCKASACGFGEYDHEQKRCRHLAFESLISFTPKWGFPPTQEPSIITYRCAIASEIRKDPTSSISPAFGEGCCRTLGNEVRDRIVRALRDKHIGSDFNDYLKEEGIFEEVEAMVRIREGKVSKGGLNERPTTPPPLPPKGQGGRK